IRAVIPDCRAFSESSARACRGGRRADRWTYGSNLSVGSQQKTTSAFRGSQQKAFRPKRARTVVDDCWPSKLRTGRNGRPVTPSREVANDNQVFCKLIRVHNDRCENCQADSK